MNSISEYAKRIEQRNIVKQETRITVITSVIMMVTCLIYGLIANSLKIRPTMFAATEDKVYGIVNLIIILIFIAILAVRRSIYYSPKLVNDDSTLPEILAKWRKVDIALLMVAEIIPIVGLVLTFLGIKFDRTFHLFLGSGILMILIMPVGIKVRSRLGVLKEHFPDNPHI